ncbi:MAG: hypothetical protein K0R81_183 [Microbacterium sp.]|nr:hypothetical protein [Microbacterium sp.]
MTATDANVRAVQAGDLWSLSWDGKELGRGVVARVAPAFVIMWPVTTQTEDWYAPAVQIGQHEDEQLAAWPTRETGIGLHLLDRYLGKGVNPRAIPLLEEALETGAQLPLPVVDEPAPDNAADVSASMIDRWAALCHHEWPADRDLRLRTDLMSKAGIAPSSLATDLDLSVPEAVAIWKREVALTQAQVATLSTSHGISPDKIAGDVGVLDIYPGLIHPRIKGSVLEIAHRYGLDEGHARNRIRDEFALAARSDNGPEGRLQAAIQRLLSQAEPRE